MTDFSIHVSDRNFNKAKAYRLTNKQLRKIKRVPRAGDKNSPLMTFWAAFEENAGIPIQALCCDDRYMVTVSTYKMLEDQVTKWMLKEITYLVPGGRAHKNAVSMYMLNYAPTDITHPNAEDNVIYYLKDLQGGLSE